MKTSYDLFVRKWAWLFPATYLFHMTEEYYGGFSHWMTPIIGAELPRSQFLNLDILFLTLMIAGTVAAMTLSSFRWLAVTFAAAVLNNCAFHLIGSVVTMSYFPGLITAMIFWLPLGAYTLFQAYKYSGRSQLISGVMTGIIFHTIILIAVLKAGSGPAW